MNYKLLITTLSLFVIGYVGCMDFSSLKDKETLNENEINCLAENFKPSEEIINLIQEHEKSIIQGFARSAKRPFKVAKIPRIYFKTDDLTRIWNAEVLRLFIKKNNLYRLDVAKKYLYKINKRWMVLSEEVTPHALDNKMVCDLETFKQIRQICNELGYKDFGSFERSKNSSDYVFLSKNFVYSSEKKIVFIDTEAGTFFYPNSYDLLYKERDKKRRFDIFTQQFTGKEVKDFLELEEKQQKMSDEQFELSLYGPGFVGFL